MKRLAVVLVGTFAMVLAGEAQVPAHLSLHDALELARERSTLTAQARRSAVVVGVEAG